MCLYSIDIFIYIYARTVYQYIYRYGYNTYTLHHHLVQMKLEFFNRCQEYSQKKIPRRQFSRTPATIIPSGICTCTNIILLLFAVNDTISSVTGFH